MKHKVLANGLQILLAPMKCAETAIAVAIKLGSRYENPRTAGIGHFCEHVIGASGSLNFPTETEMNRVMDECGGEFNGFTSRDIIMINMRTIKQKFGLGFGLLVDMLLRPIVSDEKVEITRSIIANEFRDMLDDPYDILCDMRDSIMFTPNSLAQNTEIELANSLRFRPWQIRRYLKKIIRPNRMVIVAAGAFNEDKALSMITSEFGSLVKGLSQSYHAHSIDQKAPRFALKRHRLNQICFSIGFPTFGYDDPRRYALSYLNNMLADRPSAILTRVLRSELGLVYDITSAVWQWADIGYLKIDAETRNRTNFFKIIERLFAELQLLKRQLPDVREFEVSRENMKALARRRFANPEFVVKFYAGQIATCGKAISLREYLRQINAVRRADIRRVANDVFDFKRINLAAIGRVSEKDGERLREIINEKAREAFIS